MLVLHSFGQPKALPCKELVLHGHCPVQVCNFAFAEFWLWPAELKIPKFDVTEHVKKVDTDFDPLLKSATELEAFSQKRQKEIEDEIKQIDVEIVSHPSCLCLTLPAVRPYSEMPPSALTIHIPCCAIKQRSNAAFLGLRDICHTPRCAR